VASATTLQPIPNLLPEEATLVSNGLRQLHQGGDVSGALGTLKAYLARYPGGTLRSEAEAGELDALLRLGRKGEAVALLDDLAARGFRGMSRAAELRILRGELLAEQGRCPEALAIFGLQESGGPLRERALYGRAVCLARTGDAQGSRRGFEELLAAFPQGPHADAARQALH
jgi:TolA-binding protein